MGSDSESLTGAQVRAVEHASGPLIVLAGPGTGKTRTIVHRIAHQIQVRSIEPERIVALTFTVKAANQLRERLADLIGATQAQRIQAQTIHGFGHRLVHRFSDLLGLPGRLELIDAAQSRRLLKRIVLDHGLFADSRGEGLGALAGELERVFDSLGNMALLPKACAQFAERWARRLEAAPSAPPEDQQAQEAHQQRFEDTALAYGLYVQECHQRGWITFNDLITLPIRLLTEHAMGAAICHDDYRAFIVDEFQDCNAAQIELMRLLAPPKDGGPDLCVVGDDDQAIYRFRGADERAFQRFKTIWTRPTEIELKENYRSRPELITVANAIITKSQSRFHAGKVIEFPEGKKREPALIEAIKLDEDSQDADIIAAMILADRANPGEQGQTRPWKKFAVIARGHGDLDRISAALRVEGIPFERTREKSLLEEAGVEDVLAWIEWLVNPDATWAARRVLTRPPFAIPPETVTAWETEYRAQASQAAAGRPEVGAPGRFAEWVERRGAELSAGAAAKYRELAAAAAGARGDEAVYRIILGSDTAHAELLPSRDRARRIAALIELLALARDKQMRLDAPGDLAEFWSYFNELRDAGKGLPSARNLMDAIDRPEETASEGGDDEGRVQLMTAHAAKGLEFDTVFVPRVRPPHGYPNSKNDDDWQPPEGLFDRLDSRSDAERKADEERRIFYVACTRAERRLVLLATWNKSPSKSTHFFEELTRTAAAPLPIVLLHGADVLKRAAELGVGIMARSGVELAGQDYKSREAAQEIIDRARRQARLEAALALESLDRADLGPEHLEAVAMRLRAAAGQAALAGLVGRSGAAPAWLLEAQPGLGALARRLERAAKAGAKESVTPPGALVMKPMSPPLFLSFTAISEYEKCPCCYYIQRVMRLPEASSEEKGIGIIAHAVLKDFFDRWARADAEGQVRPGLKELLAMTQAKFLGSLHSSEEVSRESLDQLQAQMKLTFEQLHEKGAPNPHILETERDFDFDYELDGQTHRFAAKIDRLDLLEDGGVRIIDYKTGYASKRYTEPKKDDLQLGIYALALKHGKGLGWGGEEGAGGSLRGFAEYWCLSTGQRGTIGLDLLDEGKVRQKIDGAARGMLEGRFDASPQCDGPCRLFRS